MLKIIIHTEQDVTSYFKRLARAPFLVSFSTITRRKTLQLSKKLYKPLRTIIYKYIRSLQFNVLNVLYRLVPLFIILSARRYKKLLTS